MESSAEPAAEERRGLSNRGLPQNDQRASERHVWRFARPDGSIYETSWQGLGTRTTAQAFADLLGHRVIGEVIPGPAAQDTPARDAGGTGHEQRLTQPPLVQAESSYTSPPLIQAEPPFEPVPWPYPKRIGGNQRGVVNKIAGPERSSKTAGPGRPIAQSAVPSLSTGTRSPSLADQVRGIIITPDPRSAGIYANPHIPQEWRQLLLGAAEPRFAVWLLTVLEPTVSNFSINLHLKQNDPSELKAAGMIFPGQDGKEQGNARENGSQKNAFRHAFGQALIVKYFDRQHSEVVGSAHETLPTIDTSQRRFSNPSAPANALFEADTVADQLNNEIGRRIAERLGATATNRDVVAAVLSEFRDKGLYVATFEGPGKVKLARQLLTQLQFDQMMLVLNLLKEDGKVSKW